VRRVLVDSGPLMALFAKRDKWRLYFDALIRDLEEMGAQLLTTWPCVTEATHMLRSRDNRVDLLHWIAAGGAEVREFRATELVGMAVWIRRYSERREMDFADASLVWLAAATGTTEILTVDRTDFERYRLPNGKSFEIL